MGIGLGGSEGGGGKSRLVYSYWAYSSDINLSGGGGGELVFNCDML